MDEHRHKIFVTLMFFMVVQHVIIVVALQLALHQWLLSLWKQIEQQDRY
jgi:hypothetical protein